MLTSNLGGDVSASDDDLIGADADELAGVQKEIPAEDSLDWFDVERLW